jgi:hypothetical protein
MSPSHPKHAAQFRLLCRLAITGTLTALIAARLDLRILIGELCRVGGFALLAAVAILLAQAVVLGYRWQRILVASGIVIGFGRALKIVLIGLFFNQCLPTALGGDGVRAVMLRSAHVPLERSINAVLVDRLSGLAGLLPFLVLGLPFALAWTDDMLLRTADVAVTALYAVVLTVYFFSDRAIMQLHRLARIGLLRAASAASVYARQIVWHSRQALSIVILAILVHLSSIALVAILAAALLAPISVGAAMVLVPPIFAAAMLPISYGGWGARELAMVVSLGLAGVPPTTALAISITIGFLGLISTLPGALLWLRAEPRQRSGTQFNQPSARRNGVHH